jgi:hypothetical protein
MNPAFQLWIEKEGTKEITMLDPPFRQGSLPRAQFPVAARRNMKKEP